jgi:hypothetical protein
MTRSTHKSVGLFMALKMSVMQAKLDLFRRRVEAEDSGDFALAASLVAARRRLDDATDEIARAERAFLFSPAEVASLIARLEGAVNEARSARRKMERLQTALVGAEKMVTLLGSLVGLLA